MGPRARRLARGWTAAGIATGAAAASHALAGGQAPPPALVLLSLALSGPLCMALVGRVLSRAALALGVLVSQSVLHCLFAVPGATTAAGLAHHGVAHGAAHGPALVLRGSAHAEHAGTAMVVAHVLAAVAAYLLMRHGEVAAVVLLEALRLRVGRLRRSLSCAPVTARPRAVRPARPHALTDQSLLRPVRTHRGPPRPRRRLLLPVLPAGPAPLPAG